MGMSEATDSPTRAPEAGGDAESGSSRLGTDPSRHQIVKVRDDGGHAQGVTVESLPRPSSEIRYPTPATAAQTLTQWGGRPPLATVHPHRVMNRAAESQRRIRTGPDMHHDPRLMPLPRDDLAE